MNAFAVLLRIAVGARWSLCLVALTAGFGSVRQSLAGTPTTLHSSEGVPPVQSDGLELAAENDGDATPSLELGCASATCGDMEALVPELSIFSVSGIPDPHARSVRSKNRIHKELAGWLPAITVIFRCSWNQGHLPGGRREGFEVGITATWR